MTLNAKTEDSDFFAIKCSVSSSGLVQCTPGVFHEVTCISRLGKRQAEDIAAILLGPCFVLTILTISSLLLDITDSLRVGIISLSIIGHFFLIQTLNSLIPQHSAETPTWM
ncbi:uncharacterized protein LOC126974615 [Leptidea sinapis]|uniref:uncharacterized protein LOC126974615 n=1 Tax=Leptidea sinapis TaxID=189913 RepID=UPI0021C445AD|nr:uncharacterized protein LOC126974615 [Leptidea sinapis]